MAHTENVRKALIWLVSAFGAVALARYDALAYPVAPRPPRETLAHARRGEADALRDGRRMDVNLASPAELELLPGIGPSLARRIVEARQSGGPFHGPHDLLRVKGVGQKTLKKLMRFLRFESKQLEHATQTDLALGPGDRLAPAHQEAGPHVDTDRP